MNIDEFFMERSRMNAEGTLTLGKALFGYYRLLEGEKANKVVIKTTARINGQPIIYFANELTWAALEKYESVRCEAVRPAFPQATHAVDYSQSTWYDDCDNGIPRHHEY